MGGGREEGLRVREIISKGLNSLNEIGVFLKVRRLEISRDLEVSGRERPRSVIKET